MSALNLCADALCPSQQFYSHVRTISGLPGMKQRIKYLAQGHNAATPVSLDLATF